MGISFFSVLWQKYICSSIPPIFCLHVVSFKTICLYKVNTIPILTQLQNCMKLLRKQIQKGCKGCFLHAGNRKPLCARMERSQRFPIASSHKKTKHLLFESKLKLELAYYIKIVTRQWGWFTEEMEAVHKAMFTSSSKCLLVKSI